MALAAIELFLLLYYRPSLLLLATTTAGGDTASHHYLAAYMRDYLLPALRAYGWSPDWFAGTPMFAFYFPLPYIAVALLDSVLPFTVAFKVITASGVLLLPVAAFACMRWMGFAHPLPVLAAAMATSFLFLERISADQIYSIYGGNIASTLAGEFPYSIALTGSLLFLGLAYRVAARGEHAVAASLTLAAVSLAHLLPTLFAIVGALALIIGTDPLIRLRRLIPVFALAFALSAFWSLPFLINLAWMLQMDWTQLRGSRFLLAQPYLPVLGLGMAGAIAAVRFAWAERDGRMLAFVLPVAAAATFFALLPDGVSLWNGRFLPFWYLGSAMLAAYALFLLQGPLVTAVHTLTGMARDAGAAVLPFALVAVTLGLVASSLTYLPSWISWNYEGFERKTEWKTAERVFEELDSLPPGRVMVEYNPDYDRYGTPRIFELIPYFTRQPTMEGLLLESSLSAPFHFYMQAEVSAESSRAIQGIKYPPFRFARGATDMELFGVRYFLASTDEAKEAADDHPGMASLDDIGPFRLYELKGQGGTEEVLDRIRPAPIMDWRRQAMDWFTTAARGDPLVFGAESATATAADGRVSNVRMELNRVSFNTTAVGAPHYVKVSYFPNWRAEGARGPWLASPSLMVVVPTEEHVTLTFTRSWVDWAGMALSGAGLILVAGALWWRRG